MSPIVRRMAAAEADALNVWAVPPTDVATIAATEGIAVTWAGAPPEGDLAEHARAMADAGATWCIYGPPPSADWPAMVERVAGALAH
jgi:hypothetical protein